MAGWNLSQNITPVQEYIICQLWRTLMSEEARVCKTISVGKCTERELVSDCQLDNCSLLFLLMCCWRYRDTIHTSCKHGEGHEIYCYIHVLIDRNIGINYIQMAKMDCLQTNVKQKVYLWMQNLMIFSKLRYFTFLQLIKVFVSNLFRRLRQQFRNKLRIWIYFIYLFISRKAYPNNQTLY